MAPITNLRPVAKAVMRTQSDARLVTLVRDGSEDAFAEIVRRHRPGLIRLARSLGSGDRAEDVVQDGLIRAWRALHSSSAEIELRPWMTTIVRNRALSAHASARDHEELDETIDGVPRPPEIVLMREELRSTVSAVNSLPHTQREALVRSALQGESHDQIAGALAISPGAVRQLIFRARCGLRAGLGALIPLPLVRQLAELSGAPGGDTGAATTIAAASAGGGSAVVKGAALVLIGAAAAGSGIALEHGGSDGSRDGQRIVEVQRPGVGAQAAAHAAGEGDGPSTIGLDRGAGGGGSAGADEHGSGPAGGSTSDGAGSAQPGSGGGHSGASQTAGPASPAEPDGSHQPSGSDDSPGDDSGGNSGPGSDDSSGPGSGSDDSSGPGSGSDSGSDSSGPGSGGSATEPVSDDSSGSGSSGSPDGSDSSASSGSGSSGSGSSGSGSDPGITENPLEAALADARDSDGSLQPD